MQILLETGEISSVEELTKLVYLKKYSRRKKTPEDKKKADIAKIRYNLDKLEKLNYVSTERTDKRLRVSLTKSGKIMAEAVL